MDVAECGSSFEPMLFYFRQLIITMQGFYTYAVCSPSLYLLSTNTHLGMLRLPRNKVLKLNCWYMVLLPNQTPLDAKPNAFMQTPFLFRKSSI